MLEREAQAAAPRGWETTWLLSATARGLMELEAGTSPRQQERGLDAVHGSDCCESNGAFQKRRGKCGLENPGRLAAWGRKGWKATCGSRGTCREVGQQASRVRAAWGLCEQDTCSAF